MQSELQRDLQRREGRLPVLDSDSEVDSDAEEGVLGSLTKVRASHAVVLCIILLLGYV